MVCFQLQPEEFHTRRLSVQGQHRWLEHSTGLQAITVILTCFPKNLALISLSLIGSHSSSDFSTPFLRMRATPCRCRLSFRPENKIVSPPCVFCEPNPVHLHSLIPRMWSLASFISLVICASLPVLNIVLTFQKPILVFVLVLRAPSLTATASCWLSPYRTLGWNFG